METEPRIGTILTFSSWQTASPALVIAITVFEHPLDVSLHRYPVYPMRKLLKAGNPFGACGQGGR